LAVIFTTPTIDGAQTFKRCRSEGARGNKDTKEQAFNDGRVVAIMRITDLKA
jgi:hypothetical protein